MIASNESISIKDNTANPAPLGLLGFALTTILLNLHNIGLFEMNAMILSMGIFVGGLAQILVGMMEWKKNNTFGTVAFTAYGAFWITLVGMLVLPKMGLAEPADTYSVAWFLVVWGIFSAFMFVATFRLNRALQVVFGSLVMLFFLLAWADFTGSSELIVLAGMVGVFCGSAAFYTAMAQILNEVYGKVVMPLGPVQVHVQTSATSATHAEPACALS